MKTGITAAVSLNVGFIIHVPFEKAMSRFFLKLFKQQMLKKYLSFFFSLTLLMGFIGNLLILVAILGYKKMKSPTNVFLASLALADLLLCLICIPVKVRIMELFCLDVQ